MFWIFANDIDAALAPNDPALGTTLANGGRNFHEFYLLTHRGPYDSHKVLIILVLLLSVYAEYGHLPTLQDSQDERVSFGDGNRMFKMRRQ